MRWIYALRHELVWGLCSAPVERVLALFAAPMRLPATLWVVSYRDELAAAQARAAALAAERDALVRERDALLLKLDARSSAKEGRSLRALKAEHRPSRKPRRKAGSDPYVEPFVTVVGSVMGVFIFFGLVLSLQGC